MLSNRTSCYEVLTRAVKETKHPEAPDKTIFQPTSVMALFGMKEEPFLLLIQKADIEGYPWRNQMAFPGGHVDPVDLNREATALRELEEEMGISRKHVDLIGSMGHFQTINNKDIEAFVGIWDQSGEIVFDAAEISRVFRIPLSHLMAVQTEKNFINRSPGIHELTYPYEDVVVWGVTAKIIHHLLEMLFSHAMRACAF